jgi:hypothetical protein
MPLGYKLLDRNKTDVTIVEEIVGTMAARYGEAQRSWVMDRGITSAANLAWLRQTQRRYLVSTPKSELRKCAAQIAETQDGSPPARTCRPSAMPGPTGPTGPRPFSSTARWSDRKRSGPCTNASPGASRRASARRCLRAVEIGGALDGVICLDDTRDAYSKGDLAWAPSPSSFPTICSKQAAGAPPPSRCRGRYNIRRAVERMNRETRADLRARRLAEISRKVRGESMRVNAGFARIERDPDA